VSRRHVTKLGAAAAFLIFGGALTPLAQARVTKTIPPGWPAAKPKAAPDESEKIVLDERIPDYHRVETLTGKIRSVGSSTLSNLLNRWADEFKLLYPTVQFDVTGGGSSIALPALLEGRTDLAPMSRAMNEKEIAQFQQKFGYPPTKITVGLDAIAVYVNKHNPLQTSTLTQLDGVFSITRKRGSQELKTWGQLGLDGPWKDLRIIIKAPAKTHGMHGVFKDMVLEGGEYRYDLRAEPVSTSIVQGVGAEPAAIGFASYFFATKRTRALALAEGDGGPFFPPTQKNCLDGRYPLTRLLYVYVNRKGDAPLTPATTHFLRFLCSKQGQKVAADEGNYPLSAELVQRECSARIP
jgi:phosphate transport system substrate-binding protein